MIGRAVPVELLAGHPLTICSAEDLLVMKIFAGREIDIRDAETVVIRRPALDWTYVEENLQVLDELRGGSGLAAKARQIRERRS